MESINDTVTSSYDNLCEACRNVVETYETKEAAAALDAKVDAVIHQVQTIMTAVASHGPTVPDTTAQEFDVATPVNADHDQASGVPGDPWQRAAEDARVRAGQSETVRATTGWSGPMAESC